MQNYLLVRCHGFSLLVDTEHIVEILPDTRKEDHEQFIRLREMQIPWFNLNGIFSKTSMQSCRDCLILNLKESDTGFVALGVGEVSNIEALNDDEFEDLPSLNFPYNDYFDKVYFHPATNECIYRLKPQVILKHLSE